jgi:aspartyl-tRNA(Asn)/glutamyl-tRNA(Gln) amidotransferase subunit B
MRSASEAGAYLRQLKLLLEYLAVSDANMEEGSLRVDANVSARPHGAAELGTKTEIKNMNSFSGVERALETEFQRHCALLDRGEPVVQQTMLWDALRSEVRLARSKEGSHDYRYFPEPDLPPLRLSPAWIDAERASLPELPAAKRARLQREYGLAQTDAEILTATRSLADYFEEVARAYGEGKAAANWIMGEVLAAVHNAAISIEDFSVMPRDLAGLLALIRDGTVSHSAAKRVFALMVQSGEGPKVIAEREGLFQIGDENQLRIWIREVFEENGDEGRRLLAGEKKLLGVLVGLVMKKSKGSADPRKVSQMIAEWKRG